LKLLAFTNDPISAYVAKGEIKPRYFNPGNLFDDICLITPGQDDVRPDEVKEVAGDAGLEIIPFGVFRPSRPWTFPGYRRRALELVRRCGPDVIRAYNPQVFGYLATYCGRRLGIPTVVSVHNNYGNDVRRVLWHRRQYGRFLVTAAYRFTLEPSTLSNADALIAAYEYAAEYVRSVIDRPVDVVYNRVYFKPADGEPEPRERLRVICVGLLARPKGQHLLLEALRFADFELLLVGDGDQRGALERLARELGVDERVRFLGSVPNEDLPALYHSADAFASAMEWGGLNIPTLEAGASGLPLVLCRTPWEPEPELFGDVALTPDRSPRAIAEAIKTLKDGTLRRSVAEQCLERASEYSGEKMEEQERSVYERLLAARAGGRSSDLS